MINTNLNFVIEVFKVFGQNQSAFNYILATQESFDQAKVMRREQICDELDAQRVLVSHQEDIHAKKLFVDQIRLDAVKANVTFKLEK